MTQRELNEQLAAIPEVQSVEVARVTSDDVIVLRVKSRLPHTAVQRIEQQLRTIWPNNRVAVLEDGAELQIVRGQ